jgi:hypothetical protein
MYSLETFLVLVYPKFISTFNNFTLSIAKIYSFFAGSKVHLGYSIEELDIPAPKIL